MGWFILFINVKFLCNMKDLFAIIVFENKSYQENACHSFIIYILSLFDHTIYWFTIYLHILKLLQIFWFKQKSDFLISRFSKYVYRSYEKKNGFMHLLPSILFFDVTFTALLIYCSMFCHPGLIFYGYIKRTFAKFCSNLRPNQSKIISLFLHHISYETIHYKTSSLDFYF